MEKTFALIASKVVVSSSWDPICYKDRSYCSKADCPVRGCARNQSNIDQEHFKAVGLPLAVMDLSKDCLLIKSYLDK